MRPLNIDLRLAVMLAIAMMAVAVAVMGVLSPPLAAALFGLVAAATALAGLRASPATALLVAAAGVVVFAFAHLALRVMELDPASSLLQPAELVTNPLAGRVEVWSPVVVAAVLLLALIGLGEIASREIASQWQVRSRQQKLIALLAKEDAETGLSSREHALQVAESEIGRARRYKRRLALALVGVDAPPGDAAGATERAETMAQLADVCREGLRQLDVVSRFGAWEVLMVLPETPLEGARTVLSRIASRSKQRLSRPVRMAVMVFPDDAPSLEDLVTELEAALAVCRTAGLTIGDSTLLTAGAESTPTTA